MIVLLDMFLCVLSLVWVHANILEFSGNCCPHQIDEDVKRHNELLEVIKGTSPDDISAVVARRRKDFTKEFFVHLHTVAESYYDNPTEQNGDAS